MKNCTETEAAICVYVICLRCNKWNYRDDSKDLHSVYGEKEGMDAFRTTVRNSDMTENKVELKRFFCQKNLSGINVLCFQASSTSSV